MNWLQHGIHMEIRKQETNTITSTNIQHNELLEAQLGKEKTHLRRIHCITGMSEKASGTEIVPSVTEW